MARSRLTLFSLLPALAVATLAARARAAEATRVVSALGADDRFDFNLTLTWLRDHKTARINRELQSERGAGRTLLIPDLRYLQTRNTLKLRVDVGVLPDLGLHVEAPYVISDDRSLDFDDGVSQNNSLILESGILPGFGTSSFGRDQSGRAFGSPSRTVFRGPTRRGLEYLAVGATWAPFNQATDATKPTWTLTFDARLSVAQDMRYDAADPSRNTAVGPGFHQLVAATAVSRRFRRFDPYFGGWALFPVRTSGSPYQDYGYGGQSNVNPQPRAGVQMGFEGVTWEEVKKRQRITVEMRGRLEARFEGRSHTEMWEPLAGSSRCRTDPAQCRADIDRDLDRDGSPDPFPGMTDTETYLVGGADAGLNVQVGPYVRFRGLFGLTLEQPHFLTFADAGDDLDGNGRITPDDGGAIDPAKPIEANPVYREIFDLPGRRLRVNETRIWSLFVEASLMF